MLMTDAICDFFLNLGHLTLIRATESYHWAGTLWNFFTYKSPYSQQAKVGTKAKKTKE